MTTKSLLTDQERRELVQRLGAELEHARAEIDRLRAENAKLKGMIEKYAEEWPPSVRTILAKTSKPDYAPARDPSGT